MSENRKAFEGIRADEDLKEKTRMRAAKMRQKEEGMYRKAGSRRTWQTVVAALMAVAVLSGAFGYHTITAEAAYVSMETAASDENREPGLGLSVNRWGNVIAAESFNEAGRAVLNQVNPVGQSYEAALEKILAAAEELGYLEEEMHVDFTVCAGAEGNLVQELEQVSQNAVESLCPNASTGCIWASDETRQNAVSYDMSCNRYQLAQEIMELDGSVTMEDCNSYTFHQLKCWYLALCDGRTVDPEEVPVICSEYGCGKGNGWCPAGTGNGNSTGSGNGTGTGSGNGSGNGGQHHGQGHQGGRN